MTAPHTTGPMLFLRACDAAGLSLAVTLVRPDGVTPPAVTASGTVGPPAPIWSHAGATVWRWDLHLPAGDAWYAVDDRRFPVETDFTGDISVAFVSCNGQEHGDLDRPPESRNALWAHLARRPAVHLLLHGGDQIYADEVTESHPHSRGWPDEIPAHLDPPERAALRAALSDAYFDRYATQWAQPGYAEAVARTPSLCMWDDHDICDGWGSLKSRALDSDVGRVLFDCARAAFLVFQFGCRPDERPAIVAKRDGPGMPWRIDLPGATVLAPDLRSSRRPDRVMDAENWDTVETMFQTLPPGRTLVVSSVPALGPRLSLVERMMKLTRRMERYEDDLRDQWQSYKHRDEWKRFLRLLLGAHESDGRDVTVLSGEIHLATRAEMRARAAMPVQQLVASGISHPAPPDGYAKALGTLARLGEAPLRGHKIRLRPLPGQRRIYTAQRNYLMLDRRGDAWSASWYLEDDGETAPIPL
ncbi:alkaline phosphatase family protein [Palleronia sediminis]|uniref:Alkaline phosphatase family protein n=1 Tax=Palleronia sediminis TaxID=2547833 RepID=A0A4R6ABD9_9RHOB|nr:alkaline phosphatase D family protein [Palleronia sediminis]TDL81140.1 alkaline phosphatase family protein [Palleronia sediminis]